MTGSMNEYIINVLEKELIYNSYQLRLAFPVNICIFLNRIFFAIKGRGGKSKVCEIQIISF